MLSVVEARVGFWNEFIDYDKKHVEFIGVEAKYAAPLATNSKSCYSPWSSPILFN